MTEAAATRKAPLLAVYAALVFAFVYLPIVVLIVYSFNREGVGGFPPRHLTLFWYRQLFADGAIWDSVVNSLLVAACSVVLSLTLGLLAALALDRANFPGKALFRRLVLLPLILPGIITGLSLLMFAVVAGMPLSLWTVFLGHGTALISVATTELFAGLQKMDRAQEEASLDLGASPWQTFWRVTLPNQKLSLIEIDAYLAMDARVNESIRSLANHHAIAIRYEELVVSPYETVERIYGALNLGKAASLRTRIDQLLKSSPPLRNARQPTPHQITAVRKRCEEIYARYDYG